MWKKKLDGRVLTLSKDTPKYTLSVDFLLKALCETYRNLVATGVFIQIKLKRYTYVLNIFQPVRWKEY